MDARAKVLGLTVAAALLPAGLVGAWGSSARTRLAESSAAPSEVAVAAVSNDEYCTPQLKSVVRRVASACGLVQAEGGRGCQPTDAKKVASLSGGDFNALFRPLSRRAHIVQFDTDVAELDEGAKRLVETAWSDQRGASFFFVVARASPEGSADHNTKLSRDRAQAVLTHLQERFKDPELEKQVGLLWLGEDFAQLGEEFCAWNRSREACTPAELNRSAFMAWIDCAI
jgi:outer membrane protein OmpA-like peptidoglycan-associated protein